MSVLLLFIISVNLVIVAFQDFKHRLISIVPLVIIALTGFMDILLNDNRLLIFQGFLINIGVISLLLGALYLYFVKVKKRDGFFDKVLGWGDVVFLFLLALTFSPMNFLFVLNTGLIIALAYALLFSKKEKGKTKLIPLAGVLSVWCVSLLVLDYFVLLVNRFDDSLLMNAIYF